MRQEVYSIVGLKQPPWLATCYVRAWDRWYLRFLISLALGLLFSMVAIIIDVLSPFAGFTLFGVFVAILAITVIFGERWYAASARRCRIVIDEAPPMDDVDARSEVVSGK